MATGFICHCLPGNRRAGTSGQGALVRPWTHGLSSYRPIGALAALAVFASVFGAAARDGAAPVDLHGGRDFYVSLAPFTARFEDETTSLTLAEVRAERGLFRPVRTRFIDSGLSGARIWLRIALRNPSDRAGVWRLDLRRQYLKEIEVHAVRGGVAPERILRNTDADVFGVRPVADRYLAVDVPLAAGETVELYVAYRSGASTWLPLHVGTQDTWVRAHAAEDRLNWLLNGALFAMLLLAMLMTPLIGWRISAAFCFYLLSSMAFVANMDGVTFEHLWPGRPALNDPLGLTFALFMSVSGPLFAKVLFDTRRNAPALDRVLTAAAAGGAALALLSPFLSGFSWFLVIGYPFVALTAFLHFATGIIVHRKGLLGASPFLAGSAAVAASILYALVAHLFPPLPPRAWLSRPPS